MALLFMDSFDHYATADLVEKWSVVADFGTGTSNTIQSTSGRRSSGCYRSTTGIHNGTAYVQKALLPGDTTCTVGFAVSVPTSYISTAGLPLVSIRDGGSAQVTLRINSDFTLSIMRGTHGGTVLGTSTGTVVPSTTLTYIEMKVLIHPSAGTTELRINGVAVALLTLTGQNTRNTANTQWTGVAIGILDSVSSTTNSTTKSIDYDDFYVLDGSGSAPWNTFLGDCRVDARVPTAPGATTGFTPLAGANWQNVDDAAPDDDTTYNSAASVLTDTFTVQDAPVAGATIYGVQHCIASKKSDAGAATLAPVVRHSGVDNVGTSISPGTTYAYGLVVQSVNPGTSAAWVEADFNAAEFGYKRLT